MHLKLRAGMGRPRRAAALIPIALVALAVSGAKAPSAHAATHVSTNITTNTEWTTAGSPYIVDQSITVTTGVTLTVDAGVTVRFALGKSLIPKTPVKGSCPGIGVDY